ncbi:DUF1360 domain-containing protein [Aquibacillus rhizosphaerae]|uniref:DUF1360 domain-containing protein n=1 Tax=Aquibacillus rhizosphaerae TaxID=3051431 RepID=A0ABT7L5L4_9BACI|nr:DUF1360 domain-containing protein [Aquibacillus sp. LR5S19]MDL4841153.1 DUF1360 domain-containing protein [Aquibacillus sp. LR5S19]
MVSWFSLALLGLAAFRLTRLIVFDEITSFLRAPFHKVEEELLEDGSVEEVIYIRGKGLRKFVGELLSCHWCTAIWSAAFLYMGYTFLLNIFYPVIVILALAAISSIIQTLIIGNDN